MTERYRLLGGPGSPYSLKLRAILRYRRIPHVWLVPNGYIGQGGELAAAGKRIIPVLQYPDGSYHADSTPLAFELERRHPGERSIVPDDPAQAFVSHLVEDMADELLVDAMFDLRWSDPVDRAFCARRQMSGWMSPAPDAAIDAIVARFTERQVANRARAVPTDGNRRVLARVYAGVRAAIETMLQTRPFLLGSRPALADFGLYGQLSQCAIDPTASALMRADAVRCFQWVQTMDDLSGIDGEWAAPDDWGDAVHALLAIAGRCYLPMLVANAGARQAGLERYELALDGETWVGTPHAYRETCLGWLRDELARMPAPALERLRPLLETHACWAALRPGAEPLLPSRPMTPR